MSDTGKKGHRQRLRDHFAGGEESSRSEEALLELLLTYAIPQKDVQPLVPVRITYTSKKEKRGSRPDHERPNDTTLAEWIRHCKRAGLYEQGKLLYEKGGLNTDNLPEDAMVNVDEDYQVCARMPARAEGKGQKPKPKRKR